MFQRTLGLDAGFFYGTKKGAGEEVNKKDHVCEHAQFLWTVACQAPLSIGISRQEHWSGLPFAPPGKSSPPRDQICIPCSS